jgi:hypothetical protein
LKGRASAPRHDLAGSLKTRGQSLTAAEINSGARLLRANEGGDLLTCQTRAGHGLVAKQNFEMGPRVMKRMNEQKWDRRWGLA